MEQEMVKVYICATIDEEGEIILGQINSYQYPFESFSEKLINLQKQKREDNIEIYSFIGSSKDIEQISQQIELDIKDLVNIISKEMLVQTNRKEQKTTKSEKGKGSFFIKQYINTLFKEGSFLFPMKEIFELENGLFCLSYFYTLHPNQEKDARQKVKTIMSFYFQKETPFYLGKQVMLQSFSLQNLKDRKIIAILPEPDGISWYALLEGGYKLPIDTTSIYGLEKVTSREIPIWNVFEVDSILHNPCYAYGKLYLPYSLFEEWNSIFFYALASLPIEYAQEKLEKMMQDFYHFIEQKICQVQNAPPLVKKDIFLASSMGLIHQIKGYLKGLEETGISKNIVFQMRTRYSYLPIMYQLIGKYYPLEVKEKENIEEFKKKEWKELIKDLKQGVNYEKGIHLEEIAHYFMARIPGLKISGRRIRLMNQELDLCCYNVSENDFLWKLGAVYLVECKNEKKPIQTKVIRNMAYSMETKGITTFILFTRCGITSGAECEILKQYAYGKYILVLEEKDLKILEETEKLPIELLKEKVKQLEENKQVPPIT